MALNSLRKITDPLSMNTSEVINNRRKFPRRKLQKKIGVLFGGQYFICDTGEIGEGGLSLLSDFAFTVERNIVVTFQIPKGDFVSIRGQIRSVAQEGQSVKHGVAFRNIDFACKRQIRSYVSDWMNALI